MDRVTQYKSSNVGAILNNDFSRTPILLCHLYLIWCLRTLMFGWLKWDRLLSVSFGISNETLKRQWAVIANKCVSLKAHPLEEACAIIKINWKWNIDFLLNQNVFHRIFGGCWNPCCDSNHMGLRLWSFDPEIYSQVHKQQSKMFDLLLKKKKTIDGIPDGRIDANFTAPTSIVFPTTTEEACFIAKIMHYYSEYWILITFAFRFAILQIPLSSNFHRFI